MTWASSFSGVEKTGTPASLKVSPERSGSYKECSRKAQSDYQTLVVPSSDRLRFARNRNDEASANRGAPWRHVTADGDVSSRSGARAVLR